MKYLLVFSLLTLTNCASVIKGTSQVLTFNSNPSGAEIIIDGMSMGRTPLSVPLAKNKYSTITVKKDGYESVIMPIRKTFDPVAILNVFWDLSTTDLLTGAVMEYEPGSYNFELRAQSNNPDK